MKSSFLGLILMCLMVLFGCQSTEQKAKTIERAFEKAKVSYCPPPIKLAADTYLLYLHALRENNLS